MSVGTPTQMPQMHARRTLSQDKNRVLLLEVAEGLAVDYFEARSWQVPKAYQGSHTKIRSTVEIRSLIPEVKSGLEKVIGTSVRWPIKAYATWDAYQVYLAERLRHRTGQDGDLILDSARWMTAVTPKERFFYKTLQHKIQMVSQGGVGEHIMETPDGFPIELIASGFSKEKAKLTLVHEMTHLAQQQNGLLEGMSAEMQEGHAIGSTWKWAQAQKSKNPQITRIMMYSIINSLLMACFDLDYSAQGVLPDKLSLLMEQFHISEIDSKYFRQPHHIGLAWMIVQEARLGDSIYRLG